MCYCRQDLFHRPLYSQQVSSAERKIRPSESGVDSSINKPRQQTMYTQPLRKVIRELDWQRACILLCHGIGELGNDHHLDDASNILRPECLLHMDTSLRDSSEESDPQRCCMFAALSRAPLHKTCDYRKAELWPCLLPSPVFRSLVSLFVWVKVGTSAS